MNQNAIRVAIAKELGWVKVPFFKWDDLCKRVPPNQWVEIDELPDFCNSLDACAQFEAQLEPTNKDTAYLLILMEVCGVEFDDRASYGYIFTLTTATAPQRCEAFLRMKGLWK